MTSNRVDYALRLATLESESIPIRSQSAKIMKKLSTKPAKQADKRETWADTLRRAARDSGETTYRLEQLSGVQRIKLSRFIAGDAGLSLDAANRLGDALDLVLSKR